MATENNLLKILQSHLTTFVNQKKNHLFTWVHHLY